MSCDLRFSDFPKIQSNPVCDGYIYGWETYFSILDIQLAVKQTSRRITVIPSLELVK